jgi:MarR family transcriptional regulator, transcriptional regulator for hemolysin
MSETPKAKRDPSFDPRRFDRGWSRRYPGADRSASEVVLNLTLAGASAINRVEEVLAEFGLVLKTFSVLVAIAGEPEPLTPTLIAERTVIAKTTLTSALDVLERLDLVRREPNPTSRRSVLVRATEHGEAVAQEALSRLHDCEAQWIRAMPEADRQTLIELLGQAKGLLGAAELPRPGARTARKGSTGAGRQRHLQGSRRHLVG